MARQSSQEERDLILVDNYKKRLHKQMFLKGMTLRDVEGASGVSYETVRSVFTGSVSRKAFIKICKALDVDINTLIKEEYK